MAAKGCLAKMKQPFSRTKQPFKKMKQPLVKMKIDKDLGKCRLC
jgi:hypothetical protein